MDQDTQFRNFNNMKTSCITPTRDLVCQGHTLLWGTIYTSGSMPAWSMHYYLFQIFQGSGNKLKWHATDILDAWPCISRSRGLTQGSSYLRMYANVNWLLFFVCKIRVVRESHAMEIIKKFAVELSPFVARLINASPRAGQFPSGQKHSIVTPLLKKSTLDPHDLSNYRPVSNLSFISKIIERSAYLQMIEYLHGSNLLPEKQSAYRKCHSTETVLLDILSDVSSAADFGQVTLLGLLDQSSAFDVIDHLILLERLRHDFGFSVQVLNWVRSYLTGRSQRVYFNGVSSSVTLLTCGVHRARSWVLYFLFCIQQKSRQVWKVLGFTRIPMPTTSRVMPTQIRRRRIHSWRHFPTVSMPSRSGWQTTVYGSIRTRRKLSGLILHVASTIARWSPWSSLVQRSNHPSRFAILVSR